MFTGIIQTTTPIVHTKTQGNITELELTTPEGWELHLGQSIAHNGICLTVTKINKTTYCVELMPETLAKSTFGAHPPKTVNLERAMTAHDMLEGHIVQGHVDGIGTLTRIENEKDWRTLTITYPKENQSLLVPKGSIAIDGVSLTVVDVQDDWFSVSLIPYTLEHTTLGQLKTGEQINLEYDIIGKYIARSLAVRS